MEQAEAVREETGPKYNDAYENEIPVANETTLALLEKAQIDQQISTAKAFPRSVAKFIKELQDMATLNPMVAEACIFALPRAGKAIEGASIRFAELAMSCWGNCRVSSRVVKIDRDTVTAQGVFHDLERNVAISDETDRSILDKNRRRYKADMIVVTGNAARAIARRNAALQGIPRAFWEPIYLEARRVVAGDSKTLANRRAEALAYLQKFGVTQEMVFLTLGIAGVEDITSDHLVSLRAAARAIRDGEATVEDAFMDPNKKPESAPAPGSGDPNAAGMAGLKAAVGAGSADSVAGSPAAPDVAQAPAPAPPSPPPAAQATATAAAPAAAAKPAARTPGEKEREYIERRSKEIRDQVTASGKGTFQEQLVEIERQMKLLPKEFQDHITGA